MKLMNRLFSRITPYSGGQIPAHGSTAPTLEEHQLRRNIQTHNLAESYRQQRMQRLVEWARNNNVPLEMLGSLDRPFPTSSVSITNHNSGSKWLGPLLAGALAATGIGGSVLGVMSLLNKPAVPGADKIVEKVITETIGVRAGEPIIERPVQE